MRWSVRPTDRVWVNRPHLEAGDGGMPAIWTFWYGYNSRIYDRREMASGVPTNFTERRNLWILDWVRNYYQPDAAQWSCLRQLDGRLRARSRSVCTIRNCSPHCMPTCRSSPTRIWAAAIPAPIAWQPSCWVGPIAAELEDR